MRFVARPRGEDWKQLRKAVIAKRGRFCSDCTRFITPPEQLVLHHVDKNAKNDDLTNLVLLCRDCHDKAHYPNQLRRI